MPSLIPDPAIHSAIPLTYSDESDQSCPKLVRILAATMIIYASAPLFQLASWLWMYVRQTFVVPSGVGRTPVIPGANIVLQIPSCVAALIMLYGALLVLRHQKSGAKILSIGIAIYVILEGIYYLAYFPWVFFTQVSGFSSTWLHWQTANSMINGFQRCLLPIVVWLALRLPAVRRAMEIDSQNVQPGQH